MQDKSANSKKLRIGTRGSPLALYQAHLVQRLLGEAEGVPVEDREARYPVVTFKTSGDKLKGRLIEQGGKGLFTRELEIALLEDRIDLAVHSMKDVPTQGDPGLEICSVLRRADVRDAFISLSAKSLMDLPQGATVGTASIRRQAQTAAVRPDLKFSLLRGNVGTRLSKLEAGECAATFLASAGLTRLGMKHVITDLIPTSQMLPAPAQGAIGIETLKVRADVIQRLKPLNHANTQIAITMERAFLRALDGSCRTPIAALAEIQNETLQFRGQVFSENGKQVFARSDSFDLGDNPLAQAATAGTALGEDILREAGGSFVWDEI